MALVSALVEAWGKPGDLKPIAKDLPSIVGVIEPQRGFLLCNGVEVAQATYPKLYAKLGAAYGPAAGGNFKLPDFRDRFVMSPSNLLDPGTTRGATGGSLGHTHTLYSHAHTLQAHIHGLFNHVHDMSGHLHVVDFSLAAGDLGELWDLQGTQRVGTENHEHADVWTSSPSSSNTGGPDLDYTSVPSPDVTNTAVSGASSAADPPYQTAGGMLVKY